LDDDDDDDEVDIKRAWESIRQYMKASTTESLCYELKRQKSWFDEVRLKLLHQREKTKFQWLQNSRQRNGDHLNNVRHEASRTYGNKKTEYLKEKLMTLKQRVRTKISEAYIEA
jgi:hypothetical protein